MFGPDTALMFDAIQIAVVVSALTGSAVYFAMRWTRSSMNRRAIDNVAGANLEERVRVLERIATDRSIDLAEEIEALRTIKAPQIKETSQ